VSIEPAVAESSAVDIESRKKLPVLHERGTLDAGVLDTGSLDAGLLGAGLLDVDFSDASLQDAVLVNQVWGSRDALINGLFYAYLLPLPPLRTSIH
jgi:hypothetical protein